MTKEEGGLKFGTSQLPESAATQHFLFAGCKESGKTLAQRLLLADPLCEIKQGSDSRAVIFDSNGKVLAFLHHIKVTAPIYTLHPGDGRTFSQHRIRPVRWDVAGDLTTAARVRIFVAALIRIDPENEFYSGAARMVLSAVIESFMRHSPGKWRFSDLWNATLRGSIVKEVLRRDSNGQKVLTDFLDEHDEDSAEKVFATLRSEMKRFEPVAGLWQRRSESLSLTKWLKSESILLFGPDYDGRMKSALDAINGVMMAVLAEGIDEQTDSKSRRTWVWLDDAHTAGPLLRHVPQLGAGAAKGVCLIVAFREVETFRQATGEAELADQIVSLCRNKAFLRMESAESAEWAAQLVNEGVN